MQKTIARFQKVEKKLKATPWFAKPFVDAIYEKVNGWEGYKFRAAYQKVNKTSIFVVRSSV